MSDLISRQAAIEAIKQVNTNVVTFAKNKDALEQLPSADVVEVIRCKDCDNWQTDWIASGGGHYCGMIDLETDEGFYCGMAERRTDE